MKRLALLSCVALSLVLPRIALAQAWNGEALTLTPAGGAVSTSNSWVTLNAPSGAVPATLIVSVIPNLFSPDSPGRILGSQFAIGPQGVTFTKPVTLEIRYNYSAIPTGFPEANVRIFKVLGHAWTLVPSTVNTATHTVSANITGTGTYGAIASSTAVPPENAIVYMSSDGFVYRYDVATGYSSYLGALNLTDGQINFAQTENAVLFGRRQPAGADIFDSNLDHSGIHKISSVTTTNINGGGGSPDGTHGGFGAQVGGVWGVYLFSTAGGTPVLFAHGGSTDGPVFSPDGTKIAYADNTNITVRNASTGALIALLTPGGSQIQNLSFNPTGTKIAFAMTKSDQTEHLFAISTTGGTPLQLTIAGDVSSGRASWSPDGTQLVVYNAMGQSGLSILSATTANQAFSPVVISPGGNSLFCLWR